MDLHPTLMDENLSVVMSPRLGEANICHEASPAKAAFASVSYTTPTTRFQEEAKATPVPSSGPLN